MYYTRCPQNVSELFDLVFPLGKQNYRTWIPAIAAINSLDWFYLLSSSFSISELMLQPSQRTGQHSDTHFNVNLSSSSTTFFVLTEQGDHISLYLSGFILFSKCFIYWHFLKQKGNKIEYEIKSHTTVVLLGVLQLIFLTFLSR